MSLKCGIDALSMTHNLQCQGISDPSAQTRDTFADIRVPLAHTFMLQIRFVPHQRKNIRIGKHLNHVVWIQSVRNLDFWHLSILSIQALSKGTFFLFIFLFFFLISPGTQIAVLSLKPGSTMHQAPTTSKPCALVEKSRLDQLINCQVCFDNFLSFRSKALCRV